MKDSTDLSADPAVDSPAPGRLGPKSSSSLLVSESPASSLGGLSSRLAGGRVGPIVRDRFTEELGVSDLSCDGADVSDRSLTVSGCSSLFRFTADEEGSWGPTDVI
jgi:hypothetical protein